MSFDVLALDVADAVESGRVDAWAGRAISAMLDVMESRRPTDADWREASAWLQRIASDGLVAAGPWLGSIQVQR